MQAAKNFASLYDRYVSMVYGYVSPVLMDSTLAEDITQFCFMKLWEHCSSISHDHNLPVPKSLCFWVRP